MGTNLVIVAIPREEDFVWKISSEKVPHLTLLFLGEVGDVRNVGEITDFVQHASNTTLWPFSLYVKHRGELGDDRADVLFFDTTDDLGFKAIHQFRSSLLKNNSIGIAYNSVEQFPEWQPHLTLGYPTAPARLDNREFRGIGWVRFDRIAVWTGNFEGSEFRLNDPSMNEIAPSVAAWSERVESHLEHYGIKGMRWGVHKNRAGSVRVSDLSDDAKQAHEARKLLDTKGIDALSNKDLESLARRMELESRVAKTQPKSAQKKAASFTAQFLKEVGKQQLSRAVNDAAAKQIRKALG